MVVSKGGKVIKMSSYVNWLLGRDERKKPKIQYEPDLRRLPQALVDTYEPMDMDKETRDWLDVARNPSLWRGMLSEALRPVMSRTTANGVAGRGGMFVFSHSQIQRLLRPSTNTNTAGATSPPVVQAGAPSPAVYDSLLDIGAGDGGVTSILAPLFRKVSVTEDSAAMRWRLWYRGYQVLGVHDPLLPKEYDVVSCLNVLDRADKPWSLLKSLRASVKPGGTVLLAVVLPWCPFVEDGARQKAPSETLLMTGGECCKGASFEASLEKLVSNVLQPCGFKLIRWTKLPYLCEGSQTHEYYKLDDAVLILQPTSDEE